MSVYEKRLKTYEGAERIDSALKKAENSASPQLKKFLSIRTGILYKKGVCTVIIPKNFFSPETFFVTNELKELLQISQEEKIKAVRFQPAAS